MIIQLILLVFLAVLLIFTTYLGVYRNIKVFEYRVNTLYRDMIQYNQLPSYYIMVLKFWVPLTDKYWIK